MRLIKILVSVVLAAYIIFYLVQSFTVITYPGQLSYPEGIILNQAKLLSEEKLIYKNINDYPFILANYPPVYLFFCAVLVKLFGISFFWGRLVTFLAAILVSLLIYKILRHKTSKEIAIISAVLFISSSYIYKDTPFMRVDMLGLFFSLFGFYIFVEKDQKTNSFYSIPFFIISLYTKQTFVGAPIAIALWLFFNQRKRALVFILFMLLAYAIIFFFINHLTKGEFYRHNVVYNLNIFNPEQGAKYYVRFLQTHSILFLFSLLFIFDSIRDKDFSVFSIYFIVSAIVALSVGKVGANTNYFFEMITLMCVLSGFFLYRIKKHIDEKKHNLFKNIAIFTQLLLFLHIPFITEPAITKSDRLNFERLSQIFSNTTGEIISEDSGILVLNKKEVLFQFFEFTQISNQKLWNQKPFLEDIKNKRFSMIVLSFDIDCFVDKERLTPEMVEAIKKNYRISDKIGEYFIYIPVSDM